MKKTSIAILILVLTATLFAGCRNMGNTPGNTTVPTASTIRPSVGPQLPLPSVNPTTPGANTMPGDSTEPGTSGIEGRTMRPSARGPRYK